MGAQREDGRLLAQEEPASTPVSDFQPPGHETRNSHGGSHTGCGSLLRQLQQVHAARPETVTELVCTPGIPGCQGFRAYNSKSSMGWGDPSQSK